MRLKGKTKFDYILEVLSILDKQPQLRQNLDVVARLLHISPKELNHLFIDWCGTPPAGFLQFTSPEYARFVLKSNPAQGFLFDHPFKRKKELSKPVINIIPMSVEQIQSDRLIIHYSMANSIFGTLFIASTSLGICYMAFSEDEDKEIMMLKQNFPHAHIRHQPEEVQERALAAFQPGKSTDHPIPLHVKGTDFQIQVWRALLTIPLGTLTTYQNIAKKIGSPRSARAAGTAIGDNPVTYLVPCHRVVRTSGEYGNYMWGSERKLAMIAWEGAITRGKD